MKKGKNKLGLSCAKLRANLTWLGFICLVQKNVGLKKFGLKMFWSEKIPQRNMWATVVEED